MTSALTMSQPGFSIQKRLMVASVAHNLVPEGLRMEVCVRLCPAQEGHHMAIPQLEDVPNAAPEDPPMAPPPILLMIITKKNKPHSIG